MTPLPIKQLICTLGAPNDDHGKLGEIARSRVGLALELAKLFEESQILPTGGFGKHFNNTKNPHWSYVQEFLANGGIERTRFLPGVDSSNTEEDAKLLARRDEVIEAKFLMIVTSDFHSARVTHWMTTYLKRQFMLFCAPSSHLANVPSLQDHELARLKDAMQG